MANYVTHKITITNPTNKVKGILDKVRASEKDMFGEYTLGLFQQLKPMPSILEDTIHGYDFGIPFHRIKTMNDYLNAERMIDAYPNGTSDDKKKAKKCALNAYTAYTKCGFTNWYDWRNANWGTEGDALSLSIGVSGNEYTLEFDTACETPSGIWSELVRLAKRTKMTIEGWFYDEDAGNNCGTIYISSSGYEIDYVNTLDFYLECRGITEEEYRIECGEEEDDE